MAFKKTESGKLAIEYIKKYASELSKKAIAEMLVRDRPDLYTCVEAARSLVRHYTGNKGGESLKYIDNNKLFFSGYPEPEEFQMFYDLKQEKAKVLVIGDAHVPFHDKTALDLAMNYGVRVGADVIILNGDNFDHYSESSFEQDPKKRDPEYDYQQYQDFLFEIECAFPDAKKIFKRGNHEARWEKWFIRNGMGKHLGIPHFEYSNVMGLSEFDVLDHQTTIKIGKFNLIHGHEYVGGGGINPARWLSLRTHEPSACGHFHRSSEHTDKKHRGEMVTYWSFGCLCTLTPRYRPYNNWNHGFGFIIKEGEEFLVKNKRIWNNRIV